MALSYRIKLLLFVISALAVLSLLNVGYSALNTLSQLNIAEAQRDHWQRPADVIRALQLKPGATVVDLGCGSGYFTLKLSPQVGGNGRVIAEDIRWLPLAFLRARALSRRDWNVKIIQGEVADPKLPPGRVDAVLIVNTYHEFADPHSILMHLQSALQCGGRLVIVDREPKPENIGVTETGDHEIAPAPVEEDLRRARFQIVNLQNPLIKSDPENETWWLIVARKL